MTASETFAHRYTAALANEIESRWQEKWEALDVYRAPNPGEPGFEASRPKKFLLDMFPYPSGVGLHVGHPLGYIATDILARFARMTGHNVLHTMGFDSFGLPAEQFAVQTGQHPRVTTEQNIATMRAQLRRLGLGHERRRSVSTTDTAFYRWTQWIFLQVYHSWYDPQAKNPAGGMGCARPIRELEALLASGRRAPTTAAKSWSAMSAQERREELDAHRLAFLAEVPVNWCPKLGTVLANEEVTADGRSERGNFPVYKRPMKQWMMRITAYAPRLLEDLEAVDWPAPVKLMQRHWIGQSEGAEVRFDAPGGALTVFTTRPDTLFGATYMVLSPEHPRAMALARAEKPSTGFVRGVFPGYRDDMTCAQACEAYRAFAASRSDEQRSEAKEKTGVFTGSYAVNPVNQERIPIFLADYVMMGYGTGAIMAVPAHDERDDAFAGVFALPRREVVRPVGGAAAEGCFSDEGVSVASSHQGGLTLDGLPTAEAKRAVIAWLEARGLGAKRVTYKLRDWLFSRQRYWGEPFPIVYDEAGVAHALPESMLPVELPELENFQPESSDDPDAPPRPPLARAKAWVTTTLDLGDGPRRYTRETNTMPNWAGSCWYYLRYLDPENASAMVSKEVDAYWMAGQVGAQAGSGPSTRVGGVDLYVGGVEHAVLHLLYARFWHKVLFDLGHLSTREPFQKLFSQGYIQAFAYTDERGMYVEASKVTLGNGEPASEHQDSDGPFFYEGRPVTRVYGKMGKSLKNAVAPDVVCESYGCDTLRIYEMSMGPLEQSKPWNTRDIAGAFRFLQRVWRHLVDEQTGTPRVSPGVGDDATRRLTHKTIRGMRQDMERLSFNTAVSKLIELNNHLGQLERVPMESARAMILMLAPLAPHIAEELWQRVVGEGQSIVRQPYPVHDEALAQDSSVEIPIQVNGKLRSKVVVPAGADAKSIEAAARAEPRAAEVLAGVTVRKVIVVPGKLINFVVG